LEAILKVKNAYIDELQILADASRFKEERERMEKLHSEEINALKVDKEKLLDAVATLTAKLNEMSCNITAYAKKEIEATVQSHEEEVNCLKDDLEKAGREVLSLQEELKETQLKLDEAITTALEEKADVQVLISNLKQEVTKNQKASKYLEIEVSQLEEYRQGAEERMDALEDLNETYKLKIEKLQSDFTRLNEVYDDCKVNSIAQTQEYKTFEEEVRRLKEDNRSLQDENTALSDRLDEIERNLRVQVEKDNRTPK